MFEGPDYPKSLDEDQFDQWLEEGRSHKINYEFMIVFWDEFEEKYFPQYLESKSELSTHSGFAPNERLVAVYDLYSESRLSLRS